MGTGGRAGGGVDTPHCTGAPAPNGPLDDSDDSRIWLAAIWLLAVQLRHYAKQGFQGRHKPTATKCEIPLLSPAPRGLCAPSVPGAAKASAGGCGDLREPHASPPGHARPAAAVAAPFSKKPLISPLQRFRTSGGRLSGRRAEVSTGPAAAVAAPFSKKPLISPLERFRISGGRLPGRRAEVSTSKKMAAYSRGRSRRSPSRKRSEVLGTFSVSDARPPPQATSTTLDSLNQTV